MSIAAERAYFSRFPCVLICLEMPSRVQWYYSNGKLPQYQSFISPKRCADWRYFARIVAHPIRISIAVLNGVLCGSLWRGDWLLPCSGRRCVKNTVVKTARGGASSLQLFVLKLPLTAIDPFQSLIVHSERWSCALHAECEDIPRECHI